MIQLYKDYCAQALRLWVVHPDCPESAAAGWSPETAVHPEGTIPSLLMVTQSCALRLANIDQTLRDDGQYVAYLMAGCPPTVMASMLEVDASMHVTARLDYRIDDTGRLVPCQDAHTCAPRPLIQRPAPVMVIPDVLDPVWCQRLIERCEMHNEPSGVLTEHQGEMVYKPDHRIKSRVEHRLEAGELMTALEAVIARRVLPEIRWATWFNVTRYEGMKVVRYDADDQGHFRVHRDNDGHDTAHRRFAMTINLNQGDYQGGGLSFPEYSDQPCELPTGAAVVFSCNLAHQVARVTRGRRYALVSFFYSDDQTLTPSTPVRR